MIFFFVIWKLELLFISADDSYPDRIQGERIKEMIYLGHNVNASIIYNANKKSIGGKRSYSLSSKISIIIISLYK